jgi:hypothetical protein
VGRLLISAAIALAGVGVIVALLAASLAWASPYPALLALGLVVCYLAGGRTGRRLDERGGGREHNERLLLRHLWDGARRLPSGRIVVDPVSGKCIGVQRHWGVLTLLVGDPPAAPDALVTRYLLGFWRRPLSPPLFQETAPVHEIPGRESLRTSLRESFTLTRFNQASGAMETSLPELLELAARLERALEAADLDSPGDDGN